MSRNRSDTPGGQDPGERRARAPADEGGALIPRGVPAAVFLLATVILFGEFIFSREMLYGGDTLSLGYMARAFFAERLAAGDFPLWNPRLLGGIPFIEALAAGDSIYPTSLLYLVMEPYRVLGWKLVLHVLAGGFFMFGWIRALRLHRGAALVAGLAWVMAPVIVTLVDTGNDGKLMVASISPLVFWATESLLRSPGARTAAGLTAAVALASLTTQFQTSYFLFLSVGAYALFRALTLALGRGGEEGDGPGHVEARERGPVAPRLARYAGVFLGAALLGGAIASVQLVPAARYVTESSRRTATTVDATPEEARAYASSWSYHPEEVAGLAVPEFVGNSGVDAAWTQGTYWGRNFFKGNHEYLGITVLLLALVALVGPGVGRGTRRFMAGMGVVWLLFALGAHTPIWRIFYEAVPGISLFRAPSLSAFLVSLAATTLAAFAIHDLLTEGPRERFLASTRGRVALGGLGLLVLGLLLQGSGALTAVWVDVLYSDIDPARRAALERAQPFITRGFFLAVLFGGATVAALWAFATRRISPTLLVAALGVLTALDLGRVDWPFIRTLDFYAWSQPNANARFLQSRLPEEDPFRVVDFRDAQNVDLAMHGLDLVTGHHPNDLARYRTLLGLEGSQREARNLGHPVVLRLLNARYVLWPEGVRGGPPAPGMTPLSQAQGPQGLEAVYPYPALGRAWFAGAHRVMDDDAALRLILEGNFDPSGEVILTEEPGLPAATPPATGTVTWLADEPDERRLQVVTTGAGFLVFSENWYPGWEAVVDGTVQDLSRANYTLGAVAIERAGTHEVTLRYTAPRVGRWAWGSLAAALVTLGLWLLPMLRRRGSQAVG